MATSGEATAIKVALISMVSAIIVAFIANADKFRSTTPPTVAAAPTEKTIGSEAAPALAPGDRRLVASWGSSNDGVVRRFIMRNDTSQPMVRLFVSSSDDSADGPDRLGGVAVPAGVSISLDADDGSKRCTFDMRAVFADGRELVQNGFDVCSGLNFMWQFGGERR